MKYAKIWDQRAWIQLALCCLFGFIGEAQPSAFAYHVIGEFSNRMGQTSLIDMDMDGDLDFVFGRLGTLYWYEHKTASDWLLHKIGEGAITDVGGCPHDVNGDGWIDYVVGDSWYQNTHRPKDSAFIHHKKNMIASHDNMVVDLDGDGIKDIVALSNHPDHPVIAWYKVPRDYRKNWDYHKIDRGIHGGISPLGYADLDSDGDFDIVCGPKWYENQWSEGKNWQIHDYLVPTGGNRPDKYGLALRSWCVDLNNDGQVDIVQAEADTRNGRVFWWENINQADTFHFHNISADSTNQDFHSLAVADFDGDQDMDIVSGGGPLSIDPPKVLMWENVNGDGSTWLEHQLLEGEEVHELVAGDVDGDGDIDICSKPWQKGFHFFLENLRLN